MAIVVPFGDAQAHGSLACSITFRRSRGKVVLQKKPYGKQPNTPAQQAQKTKFSNGWKAYHQLDAWALSYLQQKAAELGTTKANLYLSQYLTDEIPSTDPMTLLKEIIDISIPEPAAPENDGIKIEPFSYIDIGPVETSYGDIYDKENSFTPGAQAIAHQREFIRLTRSYVTVVNIPFDYPLIITWKAFNDIEYTSLVRLPDINLGQTVTPSTTPMTDIKEITNINLVSTITGSSKTINFQFLTYKSSTQQYQGIGNIWDNENNFQPGIIADPYDKTFLQIDDIEIPPSTIPNDYELVIDYKDFADVAQQVNLKLPAFQLDTGTAPSTTPMMDIKGMTNMVIGVVLDDPVGNHYVYIGYNIGTYPTYAEMAQVQDPSNIFTDIIDSPGSKEELMEWRMLATSRNMIENYYIDLSYDDFGSNPQTKRVWWPYMVHVGQVFINLWLADDFSLYFDAALTDLAKPIDPNRKRLWIADDWSLYWDDAFTQLAKTPVTPGLNLWLADDFSLYYDKALTQLANTPYF